ncbi:MAG: hypothetical protein ACK515_28810 [bacterium]
MATITYFAAAGAVDESNPAALAQLLFGSFVADPVAVQVDGLTIVLRDPITGYRLVLGGTFNFDFTTGELIGSTSTLASLRVENAALQPVVAITALPALTFDQWAALSDDAFLALVESAPVTTFGNDFDNTLEGNAQGDQLYGQGGADRLLGKGGNDTLDGSGGNDSLYGEADADTLSGGEGNDLLDGGAGADSLSGDAGTDTLVAVAGDGNDRLSGGVGVDRLDFTGLPSGVVVDQQAGRASGPSGEDTLAEAFEEVSGSSFDDQLIGSSGTDWLSGNAGNDVLQGSGGADELLGGAGDDTLFGGFDVRMVGGTGADVYDLGAVAPPTTYYRQQAGALTTLRDASQGTFTLTSLDENADGALDGVTIHFSGSPGEFGMFYFSTRLTGAPMTEGSTWSNVMRYPFESGASAGMWVALNGSGANTVTGSFTVDELVVNATPSPQVARLSIRYTQFNDGNPQPWTGTIAWNTQQPMAGRQLVEAPGEGTDTIRAGFSFTLPTAGSIEIENLLLTGTGVTDGTGNALANLLTGNTSANLLAGLDGNDTLDGGGGADTLDGGAGDDSYLVNNAGVTLVDASGIDLAYAGLDYVLPSIIETLVLTGSAISGTGHTGANLMVGNAQANTLRGEGGNDTIGGGEGQDTLYGDAGNDALYGEGGNDVILGGEDDDTIQGGAGHDLIVGEAGNDSVLGGAGNDSIDGRAGNDTLHGAEEVDIIFGDAGSDLVYGGSGSDVLMGERGGVSASGGNDTLYGDLDANALDGGADTIDGDGGDDVIHGGGGGDIILGDHGNDTIEGGAGADIIGGSAASLASMETTGSDTFVYRALTDAGDLVFGFDIRNGDNDIIDLRPLLESVGYFSDTARADGYVRAVGSGADALVQVDLDGTANGASFTTLLTLIDRAPVDIVDGLFLYIDPIIGTADAGPNTITGNKGANTLSGLGGNDTIDGADNNDTLLGNEGADSLIGNAGNDVILGGDDGDTVLGGAGNDLIVGEGGNDSVFGGTGNDSIDGRDGNDTLDGQEEVDILFGDDGADSILGGNGNDVLMGERGGASATGGNDTLRGEDGDDLIDGDAGDDLIFGGNGSDVILGDNGNDTIEGGAGVEIIGGSAASLAGIETTGSDTFVYRAMSDAGDSIYGFDVRPGDSDTLDLRPLFDALGYVGSTPRVDGWLQVVQSGADALVQVDANGSIGGASFSTMVTLIDRTAADIGDGMFLFQ